MSVTVLCFYMIRMFSFPSLKLEAATGVSVVVADTTPATAATSRRAGEDTTSVEDEGSSGGLYTAPSMASTGLPLQVGTHTSMIIYTHTSMHSLPHGDVKLFT